MVIFWSITMKPQQFSTVNAASLGFAASVPTFLILSLNGTALFYNIETVAILSITVGLIASFIALVTGGRA
jgi:hypothetical protein